VRCITIGPELAGTRSPADPAVQDNSGATVFDVNIEAPQR